MPHKRVLFRSEAREQVLRGAANLADTAWVTLGPKSKAEGIVPGAGLGQLRAERAVEKEEARCAGDERTGLRILRRALQTPTRQIAGNAVSVAGLLLLTEATLTEIPERRQPHAGPAMA